MPALPHAASAVAACALARCSSCSIEMSVRKLRTISRVDAKFSTMSASCTGSWKRCVASMPMWPTGRGMPRSSGMKPSKRTSIVPAP